MAMSVKITDYRCDAILFGAIILEGLLPPFSEWKSTKDGGNRFLQSVDAYLPNLHNVESQKTIILKWFNVQIS
jgi:hypothetical protein